MRSMSFIGALLLSILGMEAFAQNEESELRVHSDPSSRKLFLKASGRSIRELGLLDPQGRSLKTLAIERTGDPIRLDPSGCKEGVHLLRIGTEEGMETNRAIERRP